MLNLAMNSPSELLELANTTPAVSMAIALLRVVVAYIPESFTALLQLVLDSWAEFGGKNMALGLMGQAADPQQMFNAAKEGDEEKLKEYIAGGADIEATDKVSCE